MPFGFLVAIVRYRSVRSAGSPRTSSSSDSRAYELRERVWEECCLGERVGPRWRGLCAWPSKTLPSDVRRQAWRSMSRAARAALGCPTVCGSTFAKPQPHCSGLSIRLD